MKHGKTVLLAKTKLDIIEVTTKYHYNKVSFRPRKKEA